MKKIDLGELRGDIVIFGGVYSNLHALEALINYTTNCGMKIKFLCFEQTSPFQNSPTTCEALFFWFCQSKVIFWGWQTCRLDIIVKDEWTVQFQDDIVVFWKIVLIVFNDLCNLFDLGLKITWALISVRSFLFLKYLSSTVFAKRSSSDGVTNTKWAMCSRQYSGWIQDSSTTPALKPCHLPWDRSGCILTSNNSIGIRHEGKHVS